MRDRLLVVLALVVALVALRIGPATYAGRDAAAWRAGDPALQDALAANLIAFEARDDRDRHAPDPADRFAGEWALVTHQMTSSIVVAPHAQQVSHGPQRKRAP